MSDQKDKRLILHTAKIIINDSCYIFKQDAIENLAINDIVRISYESDSDLISSKWSHDAPYVMIKKITKGDILGQILDINRIKLPQYILNIGDNIWFTKDNIIEIPTNDNFKEQYPKYKKFLTKETVPCTGPLFTIAEEDDSDSESGSNESGCSYSTVSDSSSG